MDWGNPDIYPLKNRLRTHQWGATQLNCGMPRRIIVFLAALTALIVPVLSYANSSPAVIQTGPSVIDQALNNNNNNNSSSVNSSPLSCPHNPNNPLSCGITENQDSTSIVNYQQPSLEVGNPINLVTGNKYQLEIDYKSRQSPLQFFRHYSSSSSDSNYRLGQGWTHTYAAKIVKIGDTGYEITQGNGGKIRFNNLSTDDQGQTTYGSVNPSTGYVLPKDKLLVWTIPDGRSLSFSGSYLVRVDYPGQSFVTLYYDNGRLSELTDHAGRTLRLSYYTNQSSLGSWESAQNGELAGHLAKITKPDGKETRYFYDNNKNLIKAEYHDGSSRLYHYSDDTHVNHLTGITNRSGVEYASWSYDEHGNAITSTHANGVGSLSMDIQPIDDAFSQGTTFITDSLGQVSSYEWKTVQDDNQVLLLRSHGSGCSVCPETNKQYSYNANYQVESVTDRSGKATSRSYDQQGRLTDVYTTASDGTTEHSLHLEYEGFSSTVNLISKLSVNPDGRHEVRKTFNSDMQPVKIVERGFTPILNQTTTPSSNDRSNPISTRLGYQPIEKVTSLVYENGLITEIDGPREDVDDTTYLKYDTIGRIKSIMPASGRLIEVESYDSNDLPTQIQVGTNSPLYITYDDWQNVTSVKALGQSVHFQYDQENRVKSVTDQYGKSTRMSYDRAGRLTRTVDTVGRSTVYLHNSDSDITDAQVIGLDGETIRAVSYALDSERRIQSAEHDTLSSDSGQTSTINTTRNYNELGLLESVSMQSGDSTDIEYDSFGRLVGMSSLGRPRFSLTYDSKGQLSGFTDTLGNSTNEIKDDFGRTVLHDSPDTGITVYAFDNADNRISKLNSLGDEIQYTWDAGNRLLSERSKDGVTTHEYDQSNGRLVNSTVGNITELFAYNNDARLISHERKIDDVSFKTEFQYNTFGKLSEKVLPDGTAIQYHYHTTGIEVGALRAITKQSPVGEQQTLIGEIDLEKADGTMGYTHYNGVRTNMTFAANGTIDSLTVSDTLAFQYTFDEQGNIIGLREGMLDQSFTYDGNRLVAANTKSGSYSFTYDSASNLRSRTSQLYNGTGKSIEFVYGSPGSGNRLQAIQDNLSSTIAPQEFNAAGSLYRTGDGFSYEYSVKQRPVKVFKHGELIAEYEYNSFGERVKKTRYIDGKAEVRYYLYDGTSLTAEADSTGQIVKQYIYLENSFPALMLSNNQVYAVHTDHVGTPRAVTNEQADVVWRADYTPFGKATVRKADITLNIRMPGQYEDTETGIHYNYFRNYDPATGRYTTSDPIGLDGGKNTYLYASANPLLRTDPLGLADEVVLTVVAGSGVAAALAAAGATVTTGGLVLIGILALAAVYELNQALFNSNDIDKPSPADFQNLKDEIQKYRPWAEQTGVNMLPNNWENFNLLMQELINAQRHFVNLHQAHLADPTAFCAPGVDNPETYMDAVAALAMHETALSSQANVRHDEYPDDMAEEDYPGYGLGPNNHNCDDEQYQRLRQAKKDACDAPGGRSCQRPIINSCELVTEMIGRNLACIAARKNMMDSCFNGGDKTHHDEVKKVRRKNIADCVDKAVNQLGCPRF